MSVIKLAKIINTNEKAVQCFQKERWRRGFGCVRCGSIKAWKHRRLKNGLQKYRCEDCKHVFSDQSTTVLKWNKVCMQSIGVMNHFHSSKMAIRDIGKAAEVNKNTVYRLQRKLRLIYSGLYRSLAPPQLSGVVEMDETKMAGEWFWGALERGTNRVIVEMVPNRTELTLGNKIWKYVEEGSAILTDEWGGYQPHRDYYKHFTVNHSKYFVHPRCKLIHTNTIEGTWRQLKRKIDHLCNGVRLHNIQSYIDEYFYFKNHAHSKKPSFFPLFCEKLLVNPTFS